jgi:protein-disulfide isomerase
VRHVVEQTGVKSTVHKAIDFAEMAKAGVLTTPAVSINGEIKVAGRIPSTDETVAWLKQASGGLAVADLSL